MRDLARAGWLSARAHRREPALLFARTVVYGAALVGAIAPRAFRGLEVGAGLLGGATSAFIAQLLLLLLVGLVVAVEDAAVDEDLGITATFATAGVTSGRRWTIKLLGSAWNVAAFVAGGCVLGAMAGVADAIRDGTSLVGRATSVAIALPLIGASLYVATLAFGLSLAVRSRARGLLVLGFALVAFAVGLRIIPPGSELRLLLRIHPVGPLWSAALPDNSGAGYSLDMSREARWLAVVTWTCAAALAIAFRAHAARPTSRI